MAKSKKNNRSSRQGQQAQNQPRGFDFGIQPKVMAMSDIEFSQALSDAKVIGCAYGYYPMGREYIPSITLVGTNSSGFDRAYEHFHRWGCEDDGDVVDMTMLLNTDGSYDIWVGPEFKRSIYRTVPRSELVDVISMNMSWIKHIDSTNPFVYELKKYCESGSLAPVIILAATTSKENLMRMRSEIIEVPYSEPEDVPSWKGVLKFNLHILTEKEAKLDPFFKIVVENRSKKNRSKKNRSKKNKSGPPKITPENLQLARTKVINTVFPVSIERVLRLSIIKEVQSLPGFEDVSRDQVYQAIFNLIVSDELNQDDKHYKKLSGNFYEKVWELIADRYEMADGVGIQEFSPEVVAYQIDLDVREAIKYVEGQCKNKTFVELQKIFRRKGYIDG